MSAEHSQGNHSPLAANKTALVKLGATLAVILVAFLTLSSAWFQTEAGYTYIYQNTLTGNDQSGHYLGLQCLRADETGRNTHCAAG